MLTGFEFRGITDDFTTCECCSRTGLKRTVELYVLDVDGNRESVTYYGTACAARVLGQSSTQVTRAAQNAALGRVQRAAMAADTIAAYGPVECGTIRDVATAYYGRNPRMRDRGVTATAEVRRMLTEARAALSDAPAGWMATAREWGWMPTR